MSISAARTAAFDILMRVERDRAFSSVLLPLFEGRLSGPDRGLCHELVLGTLRRQLKLDRVIDALASGGKIDTEVRVALRMGLYQVEFMERIPARAAINESVELVKRARKSSATGFVNALLRRATRESIHVSYRSEVDRISVETSHPQWLVERWIERLGLEDAEALGRANNIPARIAFRVVSDDDARVRRIVESSAASEHVKGCYLADHSNAELRELAEEGKIYYQDEASQMVARAVNVPPEGRFLDVCAAPGGKTGLVTAEAQPRLAVGGDLYGPRVRLLRENCERQGVVASVVRYDAAGALPFAADSFDSVLVDAPCSGTGTIRHNPELRYLVSSESIRELSSKQLSILTEASKTVKKGGLMVYSTCSLEPEEGEGVAASFLSFRPEFKAVEPSVPARFATDAGFARTWPHRDAMDGFFVAAFRRR